MESNVVFEELNSVGPAIVVFMVLAVLLVSTIGTILLVWAHCRIFCRAGFSWAMGLLMLVPLVNMFVPFILAFSDWPVQRELRALKQQSQ